MLSSQQHKFIIKMSFNSYGYGSLYSSNSYYGTGSSNYYGSSGSYGSYSSNSSNNSSNVSICGMSPLNIGRGITDRDLTGSIGTPGF